MSFNERMVIELFQTYLNAFNPEAAIKMTLIDEYKIVFIENNFVPKYVNMCYGMMGDLIKPEFKNNYFTYVHNTRSPIVSYDPSMFDYHNRLINQIEFIRNMTERIEKCILYFINLQNIIKITRHVSRTNYMMTYHK